MKCPKCKKTKGEVGHYARDYTALCSKCFAKSFVEGIFPKKAQSNSLEGGK